MTVRRVGYAWPVPELIERAESVTVHVGSDGQLPVVCPAASAITAVRQASKRRGTEVGGVLCRVVHEPIDLFTDPRSPALFCCNAEGYRHCPMWEFDKSLIARGFKSMGDLAAMEEENEAAYREDLTGSRYGDVSFMDGLEADAQRAAMDMQDPDIDGFIGAEG